MAKNWSALQEHNSKKYGNNSIYDLSHHGDEVIVQAEEGRVRVAVKQQTGVNEFRSTIMTFESQSQMERLFSTIMKGLNRK